MSARQEAVTVIKLDTSTLPASAAQAGKAIGGIAQSAQASARQTTAAMRQLPAQFTDIATQLAGGGNIGLILLQQGGQIRDSFGSIRGAAQGIASVLPPARLALLGVAGAAAAVAAAYAEGSREQDAIVRGLVLSGHAAGVTADQVNELARAQDELAGTRGQAAGALTALASSGVVAAAQLAGATDAAIRLQRVGGPAVQETLDKYIALGKDPVQALIRLNREENFLTEAVYKQVRALEDRGRRFEAAAVAQAAYTEAGLARTAELETQLGTIQRLYRGATELAREFWDAVMNAGRPDTLRQQLDQLDNEIKANARRTDRADSYSAVSGRRTEGGDAQLARLREQRALLLEQMRLSGRAAELRAMDARGVAAAIEEDDKRRRERERKQKEDRPFVGPPTFAEAYGREINDLFSDNALAKAEKYADQLATLDRLYFTGVVNAGEYDAAVAKLSNTKSSADQVTSDFMDTERRLSELLSGTVSQVIAQQQSDMMLVTQAFEQGRISVEQYYEAIQKILNRSPVPTTVDESPAAKAERERLKTIERGKDQLQGALADSVFAGFDGRFEDIGRRWKSMLSGMVADAIAADLMSLIFGRGGGGNLKNIFSDVGSFLFTLGGGARADGGPVSPGRAYLVGERGPELLLMGGRGGHVVSNAQLAGAGGGGIVVQNNQRISIDSRSDAAQIYGMVTSAMKQSQVDTWRQLKARGVV